MDKCPCGKDCSAAGVRSHMIRLTSTDPVPCRPRARLYTYFDTSDRSVTLVVREGDEVNQAVKFDGSSFLFEAGRGKWAERPAAWRMDSDEKAACFAVLSRSDFFCMSQARSDLPEAMSTPFWDDLLEEMRTLHPAAVVSFS